MNPSQQDILDLFAKFNTMNSPDEVVTYFLEHYGRDAFVLDTFAKKMMTVRRLALLKSELREAVPFLKSKINLTMEKTNMGLLTFDWFDKGTNAAVEIIPTEKLQEIKTAVACQQSIASRLVLTDSVSRAIAKEEIPVSDYFERVSVETYDYVNTYGLIDETKEVDLKFSQENIKRMINYFQLTKLKRCGITNGQDENWWIELDTLKITETEIYSERSFQPNGYEVLGPINPEPSVNSEDEKKAFLFEIKIWCENLNDPHRPFLLSRFSSFSGFQDLNAKLEGFVSWANGNNARFKNLAGSIGRNAIAEQKGTEPNEGDTESVHDLLTEKQFYARFGRSVDLKEFANWLVQNKERYMEDMKRGRIRDWRPVIVDSIASHKTSTQTLEQHMLHVRVNSYVDMENIKT
jgi:hypothetical protein